MAKTTRTPWTKEDNYQISAEVLKEYVIRRSQKSVNEFIDGLSLLTPHKKSTVRMKIQNTKHLLESRNISNTLSISARDHCSRVHCEQFDMARRDLKI